MIELGKKVKVDDEIKGLTASEAIYGFCGWLTSRKEQTVMSCTDDAGVVAERINEFCLANKLIEPKGDWNKSIIFPQEEDNND